MDFDWQARYRAALRREAVAGPSETMGSMPLGAPAEAPVPGAEASSSADAAVAGDEEAFRRALADAAASAKAAVQRESEATGFARFFEGLVAGLGGDQQRENQSAAVRILGRRAAESAGALASQHPGWVEQGCETLKKADSLQGDTHLEAAFLEGLSQARVDLSAAGEVLARAVLHGTTVVRALGAGALVRARRHQTVEEALGILGRDPEREVRLAVAEADGWLDESAAPGESRVLRRLACDPDPAVRAAATRTLFVALALEPTVLDELWLDYGIGGFSIRTAAGCALAVGGQACGSVGSTEEFGAILVAGLDAGILLAEWAGRALAAWAAPSGELQGLLYRRATVEPAWLQAAARALDVGAEGLVPASEPIRDALSQRAILALGEPGLAPAGAVILRHHGMADSVLSSLFSDELDDGAVELVAILAPGAQQRHPGIASALLEVARDALRPLETRASATRALGHLAEDSPDLRATLLELSDGPLLEEAEEAARLLARPA